MLFKRDALEDDRRERAVGGVGRYIVDGRSHVHAGGHRRKDAVLAVEKSVVRRVDEELRAVGIGSRVGHGHDPNGVVRGRVLIVELIPRSAGAPLRHFRIIFRERVAALVHKALDDAVEFRPVVKSALRQLDEVGGRVRCLLGEGERNVSLVGVERRLRNSGRHRFCLISSRSNRCLCGRCRFCLRRSARGGRYGRGRSRDGEPPRGSS